MTPLPNDAGRRGARRVPAAVLLLTLALAAPAGGGAPAGPRDPSPILLRQHSPLVRIVRSPAPALGARVEHWRLITARGDTVRAMWRGAPAQVADPWTAVMLGGFQTGDQAALLLPEDAPFNALAVDWPWRGGRTITPAEFTLRLPAIEQAALRSPSVLTLGAEAVACQRGVDPSRIVLVGASLGAPAALAALRLTRVPDAVVLVDAGADIQLMLRAGLERLGWPSAPAGVAATLAFQQLWPLEPALNAPVAAHLPVLLMNSTSDERIPRAAIAKLLACLPQATIHWRRGLHVRPGQRDVIARLSREADAWLRAHGRPNAVSASGPEPRPSVAAPR